MSFLGLTGAEIMGEVRAFFKQIFAVFSELWFWPIIFLGVMLLAVIVMAFLVKFSYENRILKSVNKLNKYFLSKPFITEENLVEFNLKMKKVPKVLRNNWQIYMLNREDSPTKYINVNTCIDKPLRTSSIEKNMSNYLVFTVLLAFLALVTGLQYSIVLAQTTFAEAFFTSTLVPLGIVVIYTISTLAFRASKNDIYACLYDNFPLYERNLTKAVTTLPSYVDYEILFTKKEIKEGIPILQQYLEKRALVEQQELEKARENSVAVEEYDFSDLGVDGSLVLERSMKESETFIKIRRRLQDEIGTIEAEKEGYKKNFEETLKDMQRKLQASRENLESLKTQQEESTNRIESNYIRKQQADEIKKQEQLEKDIEVATAKFNEEQTSLQQEIDKRQKEIEDKKEFVEQAMLLEFKHYANTLYKALTQKAAEVGNQKLLTLAQENSDLKALLTDIQGVGATEEMIDLNNGLIQNQDLTGETLYNMTNSDIDKLEDSRVISEKNEENEDKKLAEKEKNKKDNNVETVATKDSQEVPQQEVVEEVEATQQNNENLANTEMQNNQVANNYQQEQNVAEQVYPNVEQNVAPQENYQSVNIDDQFNQNLYNNQVDDDNDNDDGQQYVANQGEDLEQIQRQIDENNMILQKNRQEFENDLNNTLSRFDEQQTSNYQDDFSNQQSYNNPQPNYDEQPVYQEEEEDFDEENEEEEQPNLEDNYSSKRPRVQRERTPVREERKVAREPKPRATSRRKLAQNDDDARSARRGVRRERTARSSAGTSKRSNSEIDALNEEMQKLLNSTKD